MIKLQTVLAALCATPMLLFPSIGAADNGDDSSIVASFEGGTIKLASGWGEATACASDGAETRCYRTEQEMDAAELQLGAPASELVNCSTTLRLYTSTSWNGSVLALSARGVTINLSGYGFDNVTSSYKVGACSSSFFDGANGGAPVYPGNTSANATATSMTSGWDNRVSSVRIN